MNYKDLIKQLTTEFTAFGEVVKSRFTQLTEKVDSNKSELDELIEKVGAIEPYNDKGLKDELAELVEKIGAIKEYDDAPLRDEFEETSQLLLGDMVDLKKNLETFVKSYEDRFEDMLKDFKARQEVLLDEVSKRVSYEVSEIKAFNGEPVKAGTFVKWGNALWFNKLDDNESAPSDRNYSYDLIIAPPKAPEHKGLFKEDEEYEFNNIVMRDNASWIAVKDKPGELPGEGWRLLAKGMRGKKGEKGEAGDSVKVEFEAEKSLEDIFDRLMILEASNVKKA